jgi:hypothetical protein
MSSHSSLSLRLSCSQEYFNYGAYPGLFFFLLSPRQPLDSQPAISEYFIYDLQVLKFHLSFTNTDSKEENDEELILCGLLT